MNLLTTLYSTILLYAAIPHAPPPPPLPVAPIRDMEPFATTTEEQRNVVRAVDDFGFDYVFPLRYRYQHKGDDEFAHNSYQPDGPVRGRIYKVDEDEWSSESFDDDDPVWRALYDQLPPWMRNPANWEGGGQKQCGMPIVFQL